MGGFLASYLAALGLTVLVEVPIVAALYPGRRVRMAATCAVATVATHLLLTFGFPRVLPPGSALLAGELFATVGEAAAYAVVGREPGRALVASALANGCSFGLGMLVLR
jgi:hypothetical protein